MLKPTHLFLKFPNDYTTLDHACELLRIPYNSILERWSESIDFGVYFVEPIPLVSGNIEPGRLAISDWISGFYYIYGISNLVFSTSGYANLSNAKFTNDRTCLHSVDTTHINWKDLLIPKMYIESYYYSYGLHRTDLRLAIGKSFYDIECSPLLLKLKECLEEKTETKNPEIPHKESYKELCARLKNEGVDNYIIAGEMKIAYPSLTPYKISKEITAVDGIKVEYHAYRQRGVRFLEKYEKVFNVALLPKKLLETQNGLKKIKKSKS